MAHARSTPTRSAARRPPTGHGGSASSVSRAGRRGSSIRWDRVGRAGLLLVLGVILLLYISPVSHWLAQSETADRQRSEIRDLRREHDELRDRVASLRGQEAIEREARRLGMVREGERAVVVENLPGE